MAVVNYKYVDLPNTATFGFLNTNFISNNTPWETAFYFNPGLICNDVNNNIFIAALNYIYKFDENLNLIGNIELAVSGGITQLCCLSGGNVIAVSGGDGTYILSNNLSTYTYINSSDQADGLIFPDKNNNYFSYLLTSLSSYLKYLTYYNSSGTLIGSLSSYEAVNINGNLYNLPPLAGYDNNNELLYCAGYIHSGNQLFFCVVVLNSALSIIDVFTLNVLDIVGFSNDDYGHYFVIKTDYIEKYNSNGTLLKKIFLNGILTQNANNSYAMNDNLGNLYICDGIENLYIYDNNLNMINYFLINGSNFLINGIVPINDLNIYGFSFYIGTNGGIFQVSEQLDPMLYLNSAKKNKLTCNPVRRPKYAILQKK